MTSLAFSPEQLAESLRGPDVQAVLASLLRADPRRDMLRVCAVPLLFDSSLYKMIAPDAPSFREITNWDDVEPIVGREGWFRVVRRQEKMGWWWEPADPLNRVPEALAAVARRAAKHLENRNAPPHEVLHLLFFFNERRARATLQRLYSEADARFDLAACHELLGLAAEALPFSSQSYRAEWENLRGFYEARTRFSDDFHRSRLYLRQKTLDDKLDGFFGKSPKWILNLYATGGMGKTAVIQWLIAHRCVTPANRIPVARFDLDFIEIFELTEGVRLVRRLVEQLGPQLPPYTFGSLLDELQTTLSAEAPRLINVAIDQYEEEIAARFADSLVESIGSAPVLIIIDTIENALLHRNELAKVVALLRAIRQSRSRPNIRVLLAGRYPLKDIAQSTAFENVCDEFFIEDMPDEEALTYLLEKRKLDDEQVAKLVVKKSGGIPLLLSLYADIIRTTPGMTVKDIGQ